jgi:hypothetical protein
MYSNLFEKLSKSEMKNWNLHSNLFKPKKKYQKHKCSIQGGLYKKWYIQCHGPNYQQKLIIMDFFILVELKTKLIIFYRHTLKYHNILNEKTKQEIFFQTF